MQTSCQWKRWCRNAMVVTLQCPRLEADTFPLDERSRRMTRHHLDAERQGPFHEKKVLHRTFGRRRSVYLDKVALNTFPKFPFLGVGHTHRDVVSVDLQESKSTGELRRDVGRGCSRQRLRSKSTVCFLRVSSVCSRPHACGYFQEHASRRSAPPPRWSCCTHFVG